MKQVLEVDSVVSSNLYICKDATNKRYQVNTTTKLLKGQSVLLQNGIVVGIIQTNTPKVYDV